MTTVLLLRHGEIPQSCPRRFVGQSDLPLTDLGRRQASQWAEALSAVPLAGAWCSSLSRCRDTAELALAGQPLRATPLDDLREINLGRWEGLSEDEVRQRFPGEFERRGADLANAAPDGGESFAQAQNRAWGALDGILAHTDGSQGSVVLVVAHAGINRSLLCRALGLPLERLFSLGQDYGCLTVLRFSQGRAPVLHVLNAPHLSGDALAALLPCARKAC